MIGVGENEKNTRAAHAARFTAMLVLPHLQDVQPRIEPENVQSPAETVRLSTETNTQFLGSSSDPADDSPVLSFNSLLG
jgi:hypothetical protein